jgi:hypothetical protein
MGTKLVDLPSVTNLLGDDIFVISQLTPASPDPIRTTYKTSLNQIQTFVLGALGTVGDGTVKNVTITSEDNSIKVVNPTITTEGTINLTISSVSANLINWTDYKIDLKYLSSNNATQGQILAYDDTTSTWKPSSINLIIPSGGIPIPAGATDGQYLVYQSSTNSWIAKNISNDYVNSEITYLRSEIDTKISNNISIKLSISGGETMGGSINMGGNSITNLPNNPVSNNDATSKIYVDNLINTINSNLGYGNLGTTQTTTIGTPTSSIHTFDINSGRTFVIDLNSNIHTLSAINQPEETYNIIVQFNQNGILPYNINNWKINNTTIRWINNSTPKPQITQTLNASDIFIFNKINNRWFGSVYGQNFSNIPIVFIDTYAGGVFRRPFNMVFDINNNLFVCDRDNHCIRKITPNGDITVFAGSDSGVSGTVDGTGTEARFTEPYGITIDSNSNLFVTDFRGTYIRKITSAGVVTRFSGRFGDAQIKDGPSEGVITITARFKTARGIVCDTQDNLYVCDTCAIRKITPAGDVTTFAGSTTLGYVDATGNAARFNNVIGITIDSNNNLYVCDTDNYVIRKITSAAVVTTFAGSTQGYLDGGLTNSKFDDLYQITVDSTGNNLYVLSNRRVRKINISTGVVSTLIGNGNISTIYVNGTNPDATIPSVGGIIQKDSNTFYITDPTNSVIRVMTIED